jgi:hypothetical protein
VVAVAGLPAGATLTAGCPAAALAEPNVAISFLLTGTPGCAAMAFCLAANGTGAGGGVFLTTTARLITAAGGAATWPALEAFAPNTACGVGTTATRGVIGADAICCGVTFTAAPATGCALANAFCGTAVTAPATVRLA